MSNQAVEPLGLHPMVASAAHGLGVPSWEESLAGNQIGRWALCTLGLDLGHILQGRKNLRQAATSHRCGLWSSSLQEKSKSPKRDVFGAWAQKDSATWEEGKGEILAPKFVYRSQAQILGQSKLFLTDVETEARGEPY